MNSKEETFPRNTFVKGEKVFEKYLMTIGPTLKHSDGRISYTVFMFNKPVATILYEEPLTEEIAEYYFDLYSPDKILIKEIQSAKGAFNLKMSHIERLFTVGDDKYTYVPLIYANPSEDVASSISSYSIFVGTEEQILSPFESKCMLETIEDIKEFRERYERAVKQFKEGFKDG